jgi:hypothetical protein
MPEKKDVSEITNPKRTLVRREEEAASDPKKGTDKGDLPGPAVDFFKQRDHSKDAEGLAAALKKRK